MILGLKNNIEEINPKLKEHISHVIIIIQNKCNQITPKIPQTQICDSNQIALKTANPNLKLKSNTKNITEAIKVGFKIDQRKRVQNKGLNFERET